MFAVFRMARGIGVEAACHFENPDCVGQAVTLYQQWMNNPTANPYVLLFWRLKRQQFEIKHSELTYNLAYLWVDDEEYNN